MQSGGDGTVSNIIPPASPFSWIPVESPAGRLQKNLTLTSTVVIQWVLADERYRALRVRILLKICGSFKNKTR